MTRRLRPTLLGLVLTSLVIAGCTGETSDIVPTINVPTNPTGLPSLPGTHFTQGTAHVELSGGITKSFDVPLTQVGATFNEGGGSSLPYADTAGNSFGIAGVFQNGSTSNTLVITITVTEPQIALLTSIGAECTLAFDDTSEEGVSGSFECTDLSTGGTGPTVDATGTFEATP